VVAAAGGQSLAGVLVILGIVVLAFLPIFCLVVWMRQRATRQWADSSPLDKSYGATLKRTLYAASRSKSLAWFVYVSVVGGVGCLVAGGIAALAGHLGPHIR
jgi:hypothetical protein